MTHSVWIPPHREGFTLVSSLLKSPWTYITQLTGDTIAQLKRHHDVVLTIIRSFIMNLYRLVSIIGFPILVRRYINIVMGPWFVITAQAYQRLTLIRMTQTGIFFTNIEIRGWLMSSASFTTNKVGTWSLLMLYHQHDKMRTFELNHTNRVPIGSYNIPRW